LHPASRILTYLLAALVIPGLPFFMLPFALLAAIPVLVMQQRAPLRLLWRTRWLLLILVLGYAYGLPGQAGFPALGDFSPSLEGLAHGGGQALRLSTLLLWLDILVLALPAEALLAGLYRLALPFSRIGLDSRRAALRLGLTLKAIEDLERGRGNLAQLLDVEAISTLPARFSIQLNPLRPVDMLAPLVVLAAMVSLWLSA
jgi:energy-coupling factor transporter transmembrane protein EcfT